MSAPRFHMPDALGITGRRNKLLIAGSVLCGTIFIVASLVISLLAFNNVKQQQNFLCGLLGQSIVQQKASLDARVRSLQVFVKFDASPQVRAYQATQLALARKQARDFLNPSKVSAVLGGRCGADIRRAEANLAR